MVIVTLIVSNNLHSPHPCLLPLSCTPLFLLPFLSSLSTPLSSATQWIQRHPGAKPNDAVTITIHCHDVRTIKLLFVRGTSASIPHAATGNSTDQETRKDSQLRAISTVIDQEFVVVDLKGSSQDDSRSSGESQEEEKLQPMLRRRAVKTMMGGWRSQPLVKLHKTCPIVMPNEEMAKAYSSDEDVEMDTVDGTEGARGPPVQSKQNRTQSGECVCTPTYACR